MRCLVGRYVFLLAAGMPLFLSSPVSAQPRVTVIETHPAAGQALAPGQPLYLRLAYSSDRPLRFQARPGGDDLTGAMMNPAPAYPAGEGEALAWLAFRGDRVVEALQVEVTDARWQPVDTLTVPASYRWSESAARAAEPAWVAELNRQQQSMTSVALPESSADDGGTGWIQLMGLSVPGYFILQWLVWRRWRNGWRTAGLLPLWVAVPLLAYTLFALLAGSNLWPLMLLFLSPLLFFYLGVLFLLRGLSAGRA